MKTPVAIIIFNRPDCTQQVYQEIAKAKPEKLFVIADGPREFHPDDARKCEETRAIFKQIDWDCDVITNYSDVNLGCKMRPVTGINWVFEQCEEAIIFEDDCVPHQRFFPYCETLLEKYRYDQRVMMVGGANFLGDWKRGGQSYYYSLLGGTWGWASWRRAWKLNDPDISQWPLILKHRIIEQLFPNSRHSAFWIEVFQQLYNGTLTDIWDYQWLLSCWIHSGYRIFPEVNLISNIGFRDDATHTFGNHPLSNAALRELNLPLKYPSMMTRSVDADNLIMDIFCSEVPASQSSLFNFITQRSTRGTLRKGAKAHKFGR